MRRARAHRVPCAHVASLCPCGDMQAWQQSSSQSVRNSEPTPLFRGPKHVRRELRFHHGSRARNQDLQRPVLLNLSARINQQFSSVFLSRQISINISMNHSAVLLPPAQQDESPRRTRRPPRWVGRGAAEALGVLSQDT
jgi:hypothetical protein